VADRSDTLRVGELNRLIRYALSVTFPSDLWVEGEISSLKRHEGSGHVYFQLVEAGDAGQADATVSVALYAADRRNVNMMLKRAGGAIRMADGVHIRIRGSLDYYPPHGRLQLRMSAIDPAFTLGKLTAERDRVLAALAQEGLLDRNRSLPYPAVPTHIGLITSEGSAAHADFMDELTRSGFAWRVSLAATRVQGPGAEREIVRALEQLTGSGAEVVALVRGGGARTDLMVFDAEVIARAIAGSTTPVITGIGHEIDSSVADAVAAVAHKTPTACAAALVEQARTGMRRAESAWDRIAERAEATTQHAGRRLEDQSHRVVLRSHAVVELASRSLEHRTHRLQRTHSQVLDRADQHLAAATTRVGVLDPARALARGWSITRRADGTVLRDPADAPPGSQLRTTVAGGVIESTVIGQTADDER
jgi:exodeoxyribonuclease VII large subunit